MSKKRNFLDSYAKEFPGVIKRAKNDDEFHCIPCDEDFSLASAGKGAITQHICKSKHKQNERAMNISVGIQAFAVNSSAPTSIDRQTAAEDGDNHH